MKKSELVIYEALHKVGDDPIKSQIENDIYETFKNNPIILKAINDIFQKAIDTKNDNDREIIDFMKKRVESLKYCAKLH